MARLVVALAAVAALLGWATVGTAGHVSVTATTLRAAILAIPVAPEVRQGYNRRLFGTWVDADDDGCDTRDEVLIAEATTRPTISAGCRLTGGLWFSAYDGETFTQASKLDIDHMVPLAEAWDSGARDWTDTERAAYANDLGFPGALVAVSASSNRSKGDRDPARWMPTRDADTCTYVSDWVTQKRRWRLSVDEDERGALLRIAATCTTVRAVPVVLAGVLKTVVTYTPKAAGGGGSSSGAGGALGSPTTPTPTATTTAPSAPAARRFANCTEARAAGVTPIRRGTPMYDANTQLDRDKDGVACE